ncbi:MAG: molybdopterin-dependent oxidoreductase [Treponema sp.]|nr:molybdopterin-dependent oxidoreductase [Treponema sp.]MCL2272320.1 molybdopterin-dependent oxidoreductase [Treponema sp.]
MQIDSSVYLEDIYPQNLLYGVTIRSPVAKGYLKYLVLPKLPDHYTVVTAKHIPGENRFEETAMPVLADGKLSYAGEPVAVIFGPDKIKLEELAAMINVAADEEIPFFLIDGVRADNANGIVREINIGNCGEKTGETFTCSYETGIQDQWYAEPSGAITWYSKTSDKKKQAGKTLVVKTATQWPYHVKRSVSRVLAVDQSMISMEPSALSLHMDGKLWFPSLIACHAALGTYLTKKPVRLILNRVDDFKYSPKRCKSNIDITSNFDNNGNITGAEILININMGAHSVNDNEILDLMCLGVIGNYRIDNLKLEAHAVNSNIPPQGPFSGFGLSQGFFAIERHVSQIADKIKQDPAIWRKNHIITCKNQIDTNNLIDLTAKSGDYYRKWTSYELLRQNYRERIPEKGENPRGIGIAVGFQGNGMLYDRSSCNVEATLTKEGVLEIRTSLCSSEDYVKIWEKAAMEIIPMKQGMIRLITENSPDCGPSCSSRNITAVTKLVEKCCLAIKKQKGKSPLPLTVRRCSKPSSGSLLNGVIASAYMDTGVFLKPGYACAVVEVSIDIVECIPKIRGVWMGIAGGRIISANRAKRSLTRGAAQALGWAYTENIEYINGTLPENQYYNFSIPSPADIPPIHIDFIPDDSGETRGIGELPFTCVPAAFMQAVSQAMDYSFISIPLKRKDIWEMVRHKRSETQAGVK